MIRFRTHNRRQVEDWILRHRDRALRVAWGWCGDRHLAEDLVQDACSKALRSRAALRDPGRVEAWFLRIMHRVYLDHLKAAPRRERAVSDFEDGALGEFADRVIDDRDPQALVMGRERTARVRAIVARLPRSQRQVVALVDLGEMSYGDCAEVLDIPVGTVMSRLHRARETLRQLMRDERADVVTQLRRVK